MTTNKQMTQEMERQARSAYLTLNDGQGIGINNSVADELRDGAQVIENICVFTKDHAAEGLFHACASDLDFALIELRKLESMIGAAREVISGYQTALYTLETLNSKKD